MLKVGFRRGAPDPSLPLLRPVAEGAELPQALRRAAEASGFRGEAGQVLEPAAAPRQALLGIGRRR
ncbi:hypothetical protein, partial [Falsiroseomonas oryzae]|uniref:hypothetical protein n=1 Tax=Falsiroseomonas oryzae TaxID=2766473 RepID=UPI0022EAF5FC